ncbi:MAG: type Z 30S ribosomal protein S14 [Candidatus Magasanikbacteria bacterium]|jgi:small subunit ribosomal protein S14|nr:type Z 30S ribosomal protein S14 [Candidatus Magasanikbacteria bacterium]MBT4220798.1 type Z 30S ribosomal protein S14 [Candidatus Magasanikbacteria bacterium]MBT4350143.1 type Z 30S ribosomal protein S14 [Candidatus Magasanikbacteria bacterium]MBT4541414.1 type Z 30S ribosomal protein S14 [Candidatus Magasanikbacteria bacterium]MBT6253146.1 type Z 30S ribosomal protein S14 [Candidatus Magasanikbacteria bacterium]
MATKAQIAKGKNPKRHKSTRTRNRCTLCGRPRGFYRFFQMCRICLREKANAGELPGMRKSSW